MFFWASSLGKKAAAPLFAPFWRHFHFRFHRTIHLAVLWGTLNVKQQSEIAKCRKKAINVIEPVKNQKRHHFWPLGAPGASENCSFPDFFFQSTHRVITRQKMFMKGVNDFGPKFGVLANCDWIATLIQLNTLTLIDCDVANSWQILKNYAWYKH